jgi:hypothetical protein
MEQLNILSDALATQGLTRATARRLSPCLPESIVELRVQSTTITSHYATHLRKAAGSKDFFQWFRTNYQWDADTLKLVDWDAHLAAIQKLAFAEKLFVTKFNFQWLPTGKQQQKIDPAQPTPCPSCRSLEVNETETHLYQCPQRPPLLVHYSISSRNSTRQSIRLQRFKILCFSMPSRMKFLVGHTTF